jgi:hypothetical protein
MTLDDAIRRAQAEADKINKARRTKEEFQAGRVPHGVDLMQGLLRDAIRGFQSAGVKPTHVLRELHGRRAGPLDRLRSPENKYEMLARGWRVRSWLLGDEGTLYYIHDAFDFNVRSVKETKREQPHTGGGEQFELAQTRGLLRLGLISGDRAAFVGGFRQGECKPVDIPAEMIASEHEPHEKWGMQSGLKSFVVSPTDTIFVHTFHEFDEYERLEDVLGAAIVSQQQR